MLIPILNLNLISISFSILVVLLQQVCVNSQYERRVASLRIIMISPNSLSLFCCFICKRAAGSFLKGADVFPLFFSQICVRTRSSEPSCWTWNTNTTVSWSHSSNTRPHCVGERPAQAVVGKCWHLLVLLPLLQVSTQSDRKDQQSSCLIYFFIEQCCSLQILSLLYNCFFVCVCINAPKSAF